MAYVDLNPIRAKMAESLIKSDYTSIQERMVNHAKKHAPNSAAARKRLPYKTKPLPALLPFSDQLSKNSKKQPARAPLPISFSGYVELVDWSLLRIHARATFAHPCASTGRQIRKDKRGAIPAEAKSALADMGIDNIEWMNTVKRIRHGFGCAVGDVSSLSHWCEQRGKCWVKGMGLSKRRRAARDQ